MPIQYMSEIYTGDTQHISNVYYKLVFLGSSFATRPDTIIKRNIKHIVSIGYKPQQQLPGCAYYYFDVDDASDPQSIDTLFNAHPHASVPFPYHYPHNCRL